MNCSQVADVPGWIVVTKNGNRVKLLEPKLNQTLSNCAHLIVVLGPSPLDIFPFSPSCSESCLIWQLFNLPSEESGHRDGSTGGRARVGEAQLDGRLGLPGSEVGCWQEPIRAHLLLPVVSWYFRQCCDFVLDLILLESL